jgi:hypothetical protein
VKTRPSFFQGWHQLIPLGEAICCSNLYQRALHAVTKLTKTLSGNQQKKRVSSFGGVSSSGKAICCSSLHKRGCTLGRKIATWFENV